MKVVFAIIGTYLFAFFAVIFLGVFAHAGTSTNASGTVTLTGTFQQVFAATPGRSGCFIQNNDAAHTMYVFAGPIASAATTNSQILAFSATVGGGGTFNCASALGAETDQISITGTTAGAFYASQW